MALQDFPSASKGLRSPQLGELLLQRGLIGSEELARALTQQEKLGGHLGTSLLEGGAITETKLLEVLGEHRATPTVSAAELDDIPQDVLQLLPPRLAKRHLIIPFRLTGRTLHLAAVEPAGVLLVEDEIRLLTSCMVRTYVGLEFRIRDSIRKHYGGPEDTRLSALTKSLAVPRSGMVKLEKVSREAAKGKDASPSEARLPPLPPATSRAASRGAEIDGGDTSAGDTVDETIQAGDDPEPAEPRQTGAVPVPSVSGEGASSRGSLSSTSEGATLPSPSRLPSLTKDSLSVSVLLDEPPEGPWEPCDQTSDDAGRIARELEPAAELDLQDVVRETLGPELRDGTAEEGATTQKPDSQEKDPTLETAPIFYQRRQEPNESRSAPEAPSASKAETTAPLEAVQGNPFAGLGLQPDDDRKPMADPPPILTATDADERLEEATLLLEHAEMRDDVADVVLSFCAPFFRRRVLLAQRRGELVGWRAEGEGISALAFDRLVLDAKTPSVFAPLDEMGTIHGGALPDSRLPVDLSAALDYSPPDQAVIVPIRLAGRVAAYLWADNLDEDVRRAPLAHLQRLSRKASLALEICILKNRIRMM